ncbi:restriction endonuclease subunit S [soil metagenome]
MIFDHHASLRKEKISPKVLDPDTKYIGLEHIGEGTLSLNGFGYASDVNSSKAVFEKGHILFGKLRPYFRKVIIAPFDGICSTDIWVVKPKNGIDRNFLFYWMASQDFVDDVTRSSEGTRMPRAKWKVASNIEIPDVDTEKQKEIGQILYTLDQKIHLNQQTNETLEAIAQAIFKSWFVDFDPVRAKIEARSTGRDPNRAAMAAIAGLQVPLYGKKSHSAEASWDRLDQMSDCERTQLHQTAELFPDELVESEIGEMPKGWEIDSVFNQAEYINGAPFRGKDFSKSKAGLPVIKIAELKSGLTDQTKFTEKDVKDKYHMDSGDILFSWSGNPDTSIDIFIWEGGPGLLNQHIFKIESESKSRKVFNYYFLKSMLPFFKRTAANKQTTGLGHLTQRDLKRKQIHVPSKELITGFSEIAEPIFDKVFSNLVKVQTLSKLRDTLLPKLISGEMMMNN